MNVRRWAIGGMGAVAAVLVASAAAWACVSGPSVTLNPVNAKPGETVTLSMRDFRKVDPVQVRWNDLSGPVLASFEHSGNGSPFTGEITVPEDAKPGNYVLILTQYSPEGNLSQMPVRALVTVVGANGSNPVLGAAVSPAEAERPAGLVSSDESISGASLVLAALGVAGVAMFIAGMAALLAGRKARAPEAARVQG